MLRFHQATLENFRCYSRLDITFEPDLTVIFAENAGGKSALLTALAMGLALLQPRHPRALTLDGRRDTRRVRGSSSRWEPAESVGLVFEATIGESSRESWATVASPTSKRATQDIAAASEAIEKARAKGARWPLIGFYGTARLFGEQAKAKRTKTTPTLYDRWEGYTDCLEPSLSDEPLLDWLQREALGDLGRHRRGEPERRLDLGVFHAMKRATPGVEEIWYEAPEGACKIRFDSGHEASWAELSDGYHVFLGLVGDIARRAIILNEQDGAEAPLLVEGVVLIDEVDLHLHPQWQRVVLHGLRAAFPKLQLIVTTHSPQVLSSAENRQVRRLVSWALKEGPVFVEGRDTNAILREEMGTGDRDEPRGEALLRTLYEAIDGENKEEAKRLLGELRAKWGTLDPELIRAEGLLDEEG